MITKILIQFDKGSAFTSSGRRVKRLFLSLQQTIDYCILGIGKSKIYLTVFGNPFRRGKEEKLVLNNRTTSRNAVIVSAQVFG